MRRWMIALVGLALAVLPVPSLADGLAVGGSDRAVVQLPASALAASYRNVGYSVDVLHGRATVRVDLEPLGTSSPFDPPEQPRTDPISRVARSVTAGATTRYQAVSRILDWVARNIEYDLDREAPQDAVSVLERRSGYCTGVARVTVSMLEAVNIVAREIPGYVAGEDQFGWPARFHRWVEVFYPDLGWVYSDPLVSHHYVPATYVPLASEALLPNPESDRGVLLERHDEREVVDLFPFSPPGVTARRNRSRQLAGALRVTVAGADAGVAVLEGRQSRRVRALVDGRGTFVGVEPGTYTLRVHVEGRPLVEKRVVFRDRVRGAVFVPAPG